MRILFSLPTRAAFALAIGLVFAPPGSVFAQTNEFGELLPERVAVPDEVRVAYEAGEMAEVVRELAPLAADCVAGRFETGPCAEQVLVTADAAVRSGNLAVLMRMEWLAGGMELSQDEARRLFEVQELLARRAINSGLMQEALDYLRHAQAAGIFAFGERAFELATIHHNRGFVLEKQGLYAQAEEEYREAIAIKLAASERGKASLASSYSAMAIVLERLGRTAQAEQILRSALALAEENGGTARSRVAILTNLGANLYQQGRPAEALEVLERAHALAIRSLGAEGYMQSVLLNNLGNALSALGRNEEARAYYRDSLEMRLRFTATGDAARIMPMINFAQFLRDLGQLDESLALYEAALQELAAKDWALPQAIRTREELAGVLLAKGRPARARYVLIPATSGLIERVGAYEGFDAQAKAEIDRAGSMFALQIRIAWVLAERSQPR